MVATVSADNGSVSGSAGIKLSSDSSGVLALQSGANTTAVTIDTSQNVGIGTTSPSTYSAKLAVVASSGVANQWLVGGASSGAYAYFSNNAQSSTANTMQIGQGWASGSDNIGFLNTNGANPILFATNGVERMRIDSSGHVLVRTTTSTNFQDGISLYSASQNSQILVGHGNGASSGNYYAAFYYNTNTIVTITQNGTTAVAYNTSSDYRLKETIAPLTGALNKVSQLKPVSYTWKASPDETGEGFIAHELAEVCPQAVHGTKDEVDADGNPKYQGIDTSFLVATLSAAIQELKAINDQQAETINALTARIVALESKGTV